GPGGGPDAGPYADNLLARWREPHRRYHTVAHLTAVLDHVDELAEYAEDPDVVRLAAWFHDAVYLPDRSENEERSARLAERALTEAGVPEAKAAEVARLVRLTVTHDPADDDLNGQVLCDADLAVLAGSPSAYAAYTVAVREEYHFVPGDAFREGRAAPPGAGRGAPPRAPGAPSRGAGAPVRRQLPGLPRLFRTPYGAEHWEATARHNLRGELEMLSTPAPPFS